MTFGAKSTTDEVLAGVDLTGKRVLVTGVSAGLGVETRGRWRRMARRSSARRATSARRSRRPTRPASPRTAARWS